MRTAQSISVWMGHHASWMQARDHARMPRLPTFTQIRPLRYLDLDNEDMPAHIVTSLTHSGLDWILTGSRPTRFWRDARLNDREWRERHMDDSDPAWPTKDTRARGSRCEEGRRAHAGSVSKTAPRHARPKPVNRRRRAKQQNIDSG
ncbi:hypothetical protein N657DRAFT_669428 [Parathielavia appendiculata]|uniref:Uncharacterized protein n=1 Tax=Parathielavia appendiculata TaxID=2587402 RepID=A0AAN6U848_9PEZI|nr:hypothetical protein N657DRAFT_669428 [Parathielavia appendiculata]